jgi:hypothetical protein
MPPVRFLIAGLLAASLQCAAAPFAIHLGDARVALDVPPGFADTTFTGSPRLQEAAEQMTSPSSRILAFALSDADLRKFSQGDVVEMKRFMIASTPREFERDGVTAGTFARLSADLLADGGPPAGEANYAAFLDNHPPGRARALAELARQPGLTSLLMGTRLPAKRDEKPQYMLSSSTLLLVRGRVLHLVVYAAYERQGDVEWVRNVTARWVDDLKRLNSR